MVCKVCMNICLVSTFWGLFRTGGGGMIRAPLHNFSISYAFALKLVIGVHQRLMNTLVQKNIWWHHQFFLWRHFSPRSQIFPQKLFLFFFLQYIKVKFIIKNYFFKILKKNLLTDKKWLPRQHCGIFSKNFLSHNRPK